jgi:hypothetical protein
MKFADTHFMKEGGDYWLESGKRKFWWMYEDEVVGEGLTEEEEKRRLLVEKGRVVEVKPDCGVDFTAVAQTGMQSCHDRHNVIMLRRMRTSQTSSRTSTFFVTPF